MDQAAVPTERLPREERRPRDVDELRHRSPAYQTGQWSGLGFALTPVEGDPQHWLGVDLDDCRSRRSGKLDARAARIVRLADTYAEASPTGKGVKIFALGTAPEGKLKRRDKKIEI